MRCFANRQTEATQIHNGKVSIKHLEQIVCAQIMLGVSLSFDSTNVSSIYGKLTDVAIYVFTTVSELWQPAILNQVESRR